MKKFIDWAWGFAIFDELFSREFSISLFLRLTFLTERGRDGVQDADIRIGVRRGYAFEQMSHH